jgi:hypothetical protein
VGTRGGTHFVNPGIATKSHMFLVLVKDYLVS